LPISKDRHELRHPPPAALQSGRVDPCHRAFAVARLCLGRLAFPLHPLPAAWPTLPVANPRWRAGNFATGLPELSRATLTVPHPAGPSRLALISLRRARPLESVANDVGHRRVPVQARFRARRVQ